MAALTQCIVRAVLNIIQADNTSAQITASAGGDVGFATRALTIAGNTVNSVDESYAPATLTIAANTASTIDLSNSTANKNPVNAALTMARTKIYLIQVPGGQTGVVNGVLLNGLAANSATDLYGTIKPGGFMYVFDPSNTGNTVDSTHKNVVLKNLDVTNSVQVKVTVIGGRT
jgi:hypothetical protein